MKSANLRPARKRLELELRITLNCLREMGGPRDVHGMTGVAGGAVPDLLEKARTNEMRDVGFAMRERLVRRARLLAAALERVAEGTYGACLRCRQSINAARLRAIPEVECCIGCQKAIDRLGVDEPAPITTEQSST
jgi:RNA polymerase-binding transcription factor DksA